MYMHMMRELRLRLQILVRMGHGGKEIGVLWGKLLLHVHLTPRRRE